MKTPIKKEKRICKGFKRSKGHEGEPCKMPAVEGSDYCKFHGGGAVGKKTGKGRPKGCAKPKGSGGPPPKGNHNALKHGAYSPRMLPDEQDRYEAIKARFEKELGSTNLSAADERLIHQLAAVSAKFDVALEKGAPPDALTHLSRLVMDHLRELKATRASKDTTGLTGNSPAEVVAALLMKVRAVEEPKPVNTLTYDHNVIDVEVKLVDSDDDGQKE